MPDDKKTLYNDLKRRGRWRGSFKEFVRYGYDFFRIERRGIEAKTSKEVLSVMSELDKYSQGLDIETKKRMYFILSRAFEQLNDKEAALRGADAREEGMKRLESFLLQKSKRGKAKKK